LKRGVPDGEEAFALVGVASPFGTLAVACSARGLVSISLPDEDRARFRGRLTCSSAPGDESARRRAAQAAVELEQYFAGTRRRFDLALDLRGTPFQQLVWGAVCSVPFGETSTYGRVAAAIGTPQAARAVGHANGSNPLPIVVPCHRLVGSDGALRGYAGGLEMKRGLLAHEQRLLRV
jgi:methylated-DNA-[protein]-cysteine S-methyltransferase